MVGRGIRKFLAISFTVFASGCLSPQSDAPAGLVAAAPAATVGTTASLDADLYLKIDWVWEHHSTPSERLLTCQVPAGSAPTFGTCALSIPEAKLFFGKLTFTWGSTNTNLCRVVNFKPYYFMGDNLSATFVPYWNQDQSTPVDCSGATAPQPAECYMGAARYVVPGFPTNRGLYILSQENEEATVSMDSASILGLISNRATANSYSTPAVAIPNEYVANSMHPYVIECRDEWYTLRHSMTITIQDEDTATGENPGNPVDDAFSDWN